MGMGTDMAMAFAKSAKATGASARITRCRQVGDPGGSDQEAVAGTTVFFSIFAL
jgi:phage-related tail fiber protein